MESHWYHFITNYKEFIPYKPLSVILEAFFWYIEGMKSDDDIYMLDCNDKIDKLMK